MLQGAHTAIVTPFNKDESVDFGKYRELIEHQIANGIDGIVPVGTTGESPTLNTGEHLKVIKQTVDTVHGRVKVIAGTGANSTSEAVELTREAKALGIDATLQVTPYYNKPNQEGLYRHFSTVADLGVPVVLYNVPGRSSLEIAVETVARLSAHPNVVAVKEAGGDVARVK
ncbi:MAG TPA: 4-hydroxy-tetrahydrodipicolinate synthase, partial [Tichowtungia sp.]|nr:4-hydroxy-tetrahydrodipicolinate synthase [Tichowtungia sp.]